MDEEMYSDDENVKNGSAEDLLDPAIIDELGRMARKLAKIFEEMPNSLGDTLYYHMNRLHLSAYDLEKLSHVSAREIYRIQSREYNRVPRQTIIALCVGMHLEPELSRDFYRKAGYCFTICYEDALYEIMLREMYHLPIEEFNDMLIENNGESLF